MLQHCNLDNVPVWARTEFIALGCPAMLWFKKIEPSQGASLSTSTEVFVETIKLPDDPAHPHLSWYFDCVALIESISVSTIEASFSSSSGVSQNRGQFKETFKEPRFYAIVRLSSKRKVPKDRVNSPTPFATFRFGSSGRQYYFRESNDGDANSDIQASNKERFEYDRCHALESFDIYGAALGSYQQLRSTFGYDQSMLGMPIEFLEHDFVLDFMFNLYDRISDLTTYESTGFYEYVWDGNVTDTDSWSANLDPSMFDSGLRQLGLEINVIDPGTESALEDITRQISRNHIDLIERFSRGPVDLGVMLAESKQTGSMVVNRLIQLVEALKAAKKRDIKGLKKALGLSGSKSRSKSMKVEDLFLEYNFGWKQLYNDINGLIDVIFEQMYKDGQLLQTQSYDCSHDSINSLITGSPPNKDKRQSYFAAFHKKTGKYIPEYTLPSVLQDNYEYRLFVAQSHSTPPYSMSATRLKANAKVIDSELKTLQALGISNPVVAMWDLVPYSFIVDWVLNLDAIIKSISFDDGIEFLPSTRTYFLTVPYVVEIRDENYRDDLASNAKPSADSLLTFRAPVDLSSISLSVSDLIRNAALPTRLFQLEVLLAMTKQKVKAY